MNRILVSSIVIAAGALSANAALLAPGGTQFPVSTVPQASGSFVILASGVSPMTAATFTGNVYWVVWSNDSSSPFGLSGVNFAYIVANDSTSPNSIGRFEVNGFGSAQTDVGYYNGTGTAVPSIADRDSTPFGVVGYTFASFLTGMIAPGTASEDLTIRTDSTSWTFGDAAIIDGSIANVPVPAIIPAPGVAGIAGLGLLAAGRRRR